VPKMKNMSDYITRDFIGYTGQPVWLGPTEYIFTTEIERIPPKTIMCTLNIIQELAGRIF